MRFVAIALAILLAFAAALVSRACSRDLARAEARVATGSRLLDAPCGRVEYAVAGTGTPMLLIHGAGGGFDQSLAFGKRLLDAGMRIVAPSRFGYLRTPVPADYSAEAQADAHACLLDALGIERIAVLGASAGAPSALQFCIRYPQRCRALVLLVPAAYSPAHAHKTMEMPPMLEFVFEHVLTSDPVYWTLARLKPDLLVRSMLATPVAVFENASLAERERALGVIDDVQPVSRRAAGLRVDAEVTTALPRYALERIAAPTLAISVEDDLYGTWENARYTAEHIPGARFLSYPDGGHIWLGHDETLWREVADFLGNSGS